MEYLFDRYAAVTLGNKETGQGKKYEGLRVIFQVEKNSESNANTAKVSIYNLSEAGSALAEDEHATVLLEVGYDTRIEQLFQGDVSRAYISRQGADWVTTVECGDGADALRSTHIDKSYAPGVNYNDVINDVVQSFVDQGKVVIGSLLGVKSEKAQTGIAVSGSSKAVLDDLAARQGLEWYIEGNALYMLEHGADAGLQAVSLTSETGLIGSPIRREVDGGMGVEFKSLILPQLVPGRLIRIESRRIDGAFYKLRSVGFAGDTHGNAWYATGKAVAL